MASLAPAQVVEPFQVSESARHAGRYEDTLVSSAEMIEYGDSIVPADSYARNSGTSVWFDGLHVGYDNGFVIASREENQLSLTDSRYQLKLNGWGQLRHTVSDLEPPDTSLNQFQLVRGRLAFSGVAYTTDFAYFVQLDGRSTSGDDIRLLDYYLDYDLGHARLGLPVGTFRIRTGKYKVPFTMARWLSGKDFEFTDRSSASIFFDVNRSFAFGIHGESKPFGRPFNWDMAVFNGLVTGGAETGSSGALDDNFATSGRVHFYPIGEWGSSSLQDFEGQCELALRVGAGFAYTTIERFGTTEFSILRVVDSGAILASLLPNAERYDVSMFAVDTSLQYRGWSSTLEYYFRNITDVRGSLVPDLFDHGLWLQIGKFVVPGKVQLAARWSRVSGDSGTLGVSEESTDEVAAALGWYFRENHAKMVVDISHLNGAAIKSSALDITPGNRGWLVRSQLQFSF